MTKYHQLAQSLFQTLRISQQDGIINQQLVQMNFQHQPANNYWQTMYNQLVNQYLTLSNNYHVQTETNLSLYRKVQQLLQEKVNLLKNGNIRTSKTLTSTGLLTSKHQNQVQDVQGHQQLQSRQNKRKIISKNRIKRNKSIQEHQENRQDEILQPIQIAKSCLKNKQKYIKEQPELSNSMQTDNKNKDKNSGKQKGLNRLILSNKQKIDSIKEFEYNDSQQ